jgi:isocitrate/isopropylmalate dehydrogenase
MATKTSITVAHGDGIGPEIMEASLGRILDPGLEIVKTETLRTSNGAAGYSLAQGQ